MQDEDGRAGWRDRLQMLRRTADVPLGLGLAFLLVVAGVMLVAVASAVWALMPFKPYEQYGLTVETYEVCPGTPVTITVDRRFELRPMQRLTYWHVKSDWYQEVGGGFRFEEATDTTTELNDETYPVNEGRRVKEVSPLVRTAPLQEGVYGLRNIYEVHGYTGLVPAPPQFLEYNENNVLQVKASKDCEASPTTQVVDGG